jgi:hypothetical protein
VEAAGEVFVELNAGASPVVALECLGRDGKPAQENALNVYWERAGRQEDIERRLTCGKELRLPAGMWRMRMLPSSDVWVESVTEARRPAEFGGDTMELALAAGERRTVVVRLAPTVARLSGTVKAPDGGAAVGVPVLLKAVAGELNQKMGGMRRGRTDSEGRFRFDGLAPGEYYLGSGFGWDGGEGAGWSGAGGRLVRLEENEVVEAEVGMMASNPGWN